MFNPNDQMALPLLAIRSAFTPSESSNPARRRTRRTVRRATRGRAGLDDSEGVKAERTIRRGRRA